MTNVRSPQSQSEFHAGPSALVRGLLTRQPLGFVGFGQLDPTQEIELGRADQRNYSYDPVTLIDVGGFKPAPPVLDKKTVLNPSALLNHFTPNGGPGTWNNTNAYGDRTLSPSGHTITQSATHANATRVCTSSSAKAGCGPTGVPGVKSRIRSGNYASEPGAGWAQMIDDAIYRLGPDAIFLSWLLGLEPRSTTLDSSSVVTKAVMGHSSTAEYRQKVLVSLRNNGAIVDVSSGGYSAGSPTPLNLNLYRDAFTASTWLVQTNENRMLLLLGTYDLNASVVSMGSGGNSAVVRFTATNDSTLGSAFRLGIPGLYEGLNILAGESGPASRYSETLWWEETISW